MAKYEVLMAGTGGQGLVFVASFLAEAGILSGQNVIQTQTYGISQRGGFISAEVILDKEEILFQQVIEPSIVLALSDVIGARYDAVTAPVVYDSSLMKERNKPNWFAVPCTHIALEINAPKAVNLGGLGAAMGLCPAVSFQALCDMKQKKMKKDIAALNIEAIWRGMKAAVAFAVKR
jgi:2-oxoglutarate ferredoxin oxidoreductase subunit gamma